MSGNPLGRYWFALSHADALVDMVHGLELDSVLLGDCGVMQEASSNHVTLDALDAVGRSRSPRPPLTKAEKSFERKRAAIGRETRRRLRRAHRRADVAPPAPKSIPTRMYPRPTTSFRCMGVGCECAVEIFAGPANVAMPKLQSLGWFTGRREGVLCPTCRETGVSV